MRHPGNSNPLDEQAVIAKLINFLQQQPDWKNTAIIVTYDDSDGWYDHQSPHVLHSSADATADQFTEPGLCDSADSKPAIGVERQGGQWSLRAGHRVSPSC